MERIFEDTCLVVLFIGIPMVGLWLDIVIEKFMFDHGIDFMKNVFARI